MADTGFVVSDRDRLVAFYAGADPIDPMKPGLARADDAPYPAFPAADPWRHVHMVKAGINKRFGGLDVAGYSPDGVADREQPASSFYDPSRLELRGGVQSDFLGVETGTVGLAGELVFPRLFRIGWLPDFFTPRFQLGGVVNLAGRTSFVHADLLWTTNWTQRLFS